MRSAARILPLLSLLLVAPRAARGDIPPYDFNWAYIHDENNAAYAGPGGNAGRGSVSYGYRISRLEITTAQWADFLNMALRQGVNLNQYALKPSFWGASQAGSQFAVSKPLQGVLGLNWRAGAYYCNWLTNGKQESWASCQSGAYDASTFSGVPGQPYTDQLTHSPGAKFWIPTLDEYLKASHYDPNRNGQGQGGWWDQPYRSNTAAIPGPPPPGTGQTSGGWDPGDFSELSVNLGAYTNSTSAYGLWDLSGAAKEWLEDPVTFDSATGLYKRRRVFGSYAGERAYFGRDSVNSTEFDYPAEDGFLRLSRCRPGPGAVRCDGCLCWNFWILVSQEDSNRNGIDDADDIAADEWLDVWGLDGGLGPDGRIDHCEWNGCPADVNFDTFVNGTDFDVFTIWFEAGDDRADFDFNGYVNGTDFDLFVTAFNGGC